MDRVQKSKLSLYKKAMEVSARALGLGVAGLRVWIPGALGGHKGQGWPQASVQQQAQWGCAGSTCPWELLLMGR